MQTVNPDLNQLTREEQLHRRNAFNVWLAKNGERLGFYDLPTTVQFDVHEMLRKSWNAGTNYEARMALENSDESTT